MVAKEDLCWFSRTDGIGMGRDFGRADLQKSASKAKFNARADGDVRLAVHRPKPRKICENKNFVDPKTSQNKNFAPNLFSAFFLHAETFQF